MNAALVGTVYLLVLVGLAILLLLSRDRVAAAVYRWRNPPEKLLAERAAFSSRLQAPDWALFGNYLQRSVPSALQGWLNDASATAQEYRFGEFRVAFSPIDQTALAEAWVLPGVLPFAECEGDPIYLKPGAESENGVFITYHDGGDTEELAPSVEAFLGQLRVGA